MVHEQKTIELCAHFGWNHFWIEGVFTFSAAFSKPATMSLWSPGQPCVVHAVHLPGTPVVNAGALCMAPDSISSEHDNVIFVCRLCELNAAHQTFSMSTSPPVQAAWEQGQELYVHGMIYDLCDGRLTSLVGPISSAEEAVDAQKLFVETKGAAVSARGNGAAVLRELAGR